MPKISKILMFMLVIGCDKSSGDQASLTQQAKGQQSLAKLDVAQTDLLKLAERFANEEKVRLSIGQIAWAMGYGYNWGCPGSDANSFPGWSRSAPGKTSEQTRRIDFSPINPSDCPVDQPALKSSLSFRVVPDGPIEILRIHELGARGKPTIKASMLCDSSAGDCEIKEMISVGYTTTVTKTKDFSFGVETGFDYNISFSAAPFGFGVGSDFKVTFRTNFGSKWGTSTQESSNDSETIMYSCPLADKSPGHQYRGLILSVPTLIATEYKMKAKVVPTLTYEGFARAYDADGNHWLGHPLDRPIRIQSYGDSSKTFWQDLESYLKSGYAKNDDKGTGVFIWQDLLTNHEHLNSVKSALDYLNTWEKLFSFEGAGRSETAIDELVCSWVDVTDPKVKKVVSISSPLPAKNNSIIKRFAPSQGATKAVKDIGGYILNDP